MGLVCERKFHSYHEMAFADIRRLTKVCTLQRSQTTYLTSPHRPAVLSR